VLIAADMQPVEMLFHTTNLPRRVV
jgi:hypothetical protein